MRFILLVTVTALCMAAHAQTLAPLPHKGGDTGASSDKPVETLRNDTAGLLVINLSGKVVGFVFVSHTGQILPEKAEACEEKDECRTLVRGLIESGKVTTVYAGEQPSPVT